MGWQTGMNRALEFVERNLTGEIELSTVAKCANCSSWDFQRLFSLLTGIPLGQYVRRRRLALAAQALQSGNGKIIDIAMQYGYDSQTAFSRAFKQEFGITPSEVRARGEWLLSACPKITSEFIMKEWMKKMSKFSERGYVVKETGPVYSTLDMDKTAKWFEDVLGWYYEIDGRNPDGAGLYGCVYNIPSEIEILHIAPFTGIHMFYGEPKSDIVAFMQVQGIDALYHYVNSKGWHEITKVETEPWGAKTCSVTSIDGCILRFFETII